MMNHEEQDPLPHKIRANSPMTYQQIADAIGTTQQGAQQLVSRALIKFKREAAKRNINLKGFFYD